MKLLLAALLLASGSAAAALPPKRDLASAVQAYVDALHKKDRKALEKTVTKRFLSLTGLDVSRAWDSLGKTPPARAVIDETIEGRGRVFVRFHLKSGAKTLSPHDGTWFSLVREGASWKIDTREHDFHP
ncbi:MAG: hypothetical protein HUU37_04120 [Bdellovibrionales bacterium]|nr:hypothetical protein [Bdellovibrionales bacterium]